MHRGKLTLIKEVLSQNGSICVGVVATNNHQPVEFKLAGSCNRLLQVQLALNLITPAAYHVKATLVSEPSLQGHRLYSAHSH